MPINVGYQQQGAPGAIDLAGVALRQKEFAAQQQQQRAQNMMDAVQMIMGAMQKNKEMKMEQQKLDLKAQEEKRQADVIDEYLSSGEFEVSGIGSSGKAKISRVKDNYKPQEVAAMNSILESGTTKPMNIYLEGFGATKLDSTTAPKIDLNTSKGLEEAAPLIFKTEDWRNDPQLIKGGVIEKFDKRLEWLKANETKNEAASDQPIQPFAKGLGRIAGGDYYKEAAAKYGDAKATQIVDIAVKLQKQGMPIAKIEALMKEQGIDPALILKNYKK